METKRPPRMADEFEAREMHDGAPIVHRDKNVTRRMAAILAAPGLVTIVLAVIVGIMNDSSTKPIPAEVLPFVLGALGCFSLFFFGMALMFAVLRTVVTAKAVHVKYGLWGPTIPLEAITKCSVVEYDWTEFGGWGLRYGRNDARAYVPANGLVVEILYEESGRSKRVLIGTADATTTAREINRARSNAHVRIAASSESSSRDRDEEPIAASDANKRERRS